MSSLTWEAPGQGDWWLVKEHFPYPVSRLFSSLFPPVTVGWKDGGARYGLPTGEARWGAVNGWIYYGPEIPLTAGELADREVTAAATLTSSPWRDEVRRWHEEERPDVVGANRTLQGDDPSVLDDVALGEHFEQAVDHFLRWAPLHFEHSGFDVVAGLLFGAASGWGVDPTAVMELLAGASPASSAVDAHVRAIAAALDHADAPEPVAALDDVRAVSAEAAAALDAYLDDYRWRPVAGHDVLEPTQGERPGLLVASVNASRGRGPGEPLRDLTSAVRGAVPEPDRARFDELLTDARSSYALRDDDVGVCWNWPLGLLRRAGLEVGRRLADRGQVADPRHVFEADADEAGALLSGRGPTSDELAGRCDLRAVAAVADPPLHLAGGGPAPSTEELPPAVARLAEIRNAVWSVAPARVDAPLHGVGIGSKRATGTARIVRHPEELTRLVEGDVLVTVATTTAFNAVFALLAAVVTEQGGLLGHTAILARELGLPAVVGVADVFEHIHDGDVIEVDPAAGAVRLVAAER